MRREKLPILLAVAATAILAAAPGVEARDASRAPTTGAASVTAIPNPYAAPTSADRAADAYSTGFAIGLGTALLQKQREDELKRQREQGAVKR